MSQLTSGLVLGRYELLLPIAQGGMAEVWAARLHGTRGFKKFVAVKTMLAGTMDDTRLEQMFMEEAELASRIHHPNVVGTLELGEQGGMLYLVMDWVDGEPLSYVLKQAGQQGGVPIPVAVNLIGQACQGLHSAHELADDDGKPLGVVHRDISPQNILVTYAGTAKVVDFGIAKATHRTSGLTQDGELKGKLAYMAPEQLRGRPVDRRSDLFSLGIVLYLLTTGRHPFKGDHPGETLQNICSEVPIVAPSALIEGYPKELEAVVLKAIQRDPDERYATALEFLRALEKAMPSCMEASFESQVAAFVQHVSDEKGTERRRRIRIAGDLLDHTRTEGGSDIGSASSLRAVSIDGEGSGSGRSRSGATSTGRTDVFAAERRRRKAWIAGGVVAFATSAALAFGVSRSTNEPLPTGSGAPAAAAATAPAPLAVVKPVPAPEPARGAEVAAPAPAASESALEPEEAPRRSEKTRERARVVALKPVAGRAATNVQAPVSAPTQAAPTAEAKPEPAKSAKQNAWDPDAFGGRY
jgi:serine/threonine protein kinase